MSDLDSLIDECFECDVDFVDEPSSFYFIEAEEMRARFDFENEFFDDYPSNSSVL